MCLEWSWKLRWAAESPWKGWGWGRVSCRETEAASPPLLQLVAHVARRQQRGVALLSQGWWRWEEMWQSVKGPSRLRGAGTVGWDGGAS